MIHDVKKKYVSVCECVFIYFCSFSGPQLALTVVNNMFGNILKILFCNRKMHFHGNNSGKAFYDTNIFPMSLVST